MARSAIFNAALVRYVLKRLLWAAVVLVLVSFFAFLVIQLPPGDFLDSYVEQLSSAGMNVDSATLTSLRHSYGLDRPMVVQYWEWFTRFLHGDMGVSLLYVKKVNVIIWERLPWTLLVTTSSMLLMYLISIPVGIYSARHQYSMGDFAASLVGFVGMATPGFLLALVLMWVVYLVFGISLGGLQSPQFMQQPLSWAKVKDLLWHLPVPLFVVAVAGMANLIRTMRATLLDELGRPYVTTARAKGLKEGVVIRRYAVRAALNPIISSSGWLLAELFSGETVAGIVLGLPTIGPVMYRALLVSPLLTDEEWEQRKQELRSYKLPPIKIASHWLNKPSTTPRPDWELLEFWTRRVLRRLSEIGVECAGVWGYFFPKVEGYSATRQMDGAIRYANLMGDVARSYNLTMMMEPMAELGSLWPTYKEGLAFVRRVDHPNVKIMADLNYFLKLNQPLEDIKEAPELCMHCHIAGDHAQPGVGDMRETHKAFFRVLREIGYERGVSCARPWASTQPGEFDFTAESAKALAYVRQLREEVYNE